MHLKVQRGQKNTKKDLEKELFYLMINVVSEKAMENIRSHGDIKVVTTKGSV